MRRHLGLLLTVGLVLGFVSACGSKQPERLTQKTLFPAVLKAQKDAGQSHFTMAMAVPGAPAKVRSRGQIKLGDTPKDVAMAITMTMPVENRTVKMDMRVLNHNIYMSLDELTKRKFLRIDLDDTSNPFAKMYGSVMDSLDPAAQMQQYRKAVTSFDASGTPVELDGVKAQPYVMSIDVTKVKQFAKQFAAPTVKMPKSAKLVLYVGPDDLPRRMVSTMKMPGTPGVARIQMDFSRWGDPVTIFAPKPSQIMQGDPFSQPAA